MSPPLPPEPSPTAAPRWALPAATLLLLMAAAVPLLRGGSSPLLAWRGAEVWGHAWTWWWHGQALPAWPAGTDLATNTADWPVIDPLTAFLGAALSRTLGVVAAWNLLALAALAGAFTGGWWLARRVGGSGLVGGLVLAMGPIVTGSLSSGLSEDLAVGLLAVAVGLVVVPRPTWSWSLATGASLGLLAWCGPYLAWLGAITATGAGLAHTLRQPRGFPRWLLAAIIATMLALPPLLNLGERAIHGTGHQRGSPAERVEPLWQLNPWGSADLASFVTPGPAPLPEDAVVRLHPGYLGLAVLALALVGGRSRWWALLVATLLVAPGEQLDCLGHGTGISNPFAHALDLLPGGARLNHHARLLLLGQVALAALAALGVRRLGRRLGRPALVVGLAALLVALDYGLLGPVGWPLPVAEARAPDVLTELEELPPGGLLWLPSSGPGISPQRALLDQRVHRRPLPIDPNRPGPPTWLPRSVLGGWLASIGRGPGFPPPPERDLGPILERGVSVLAVASPWDAQVAEQLGPPDVQGEDGAAWDLARIAARFQPDADMLTEEQTP